MRTTTFLGEEFSRLIVGDNPFNGYSYIEGDLSPDEMVSYYTEDHVIETWKKAESLGFTGMLPLADPFIIRCLRHYYEQGGTMKAIFQSFGPMTLEAQLPIALKVKPFGMYLQGGVTDPLFEQGKYDQIEVELKKIRDAGIRVGLGSHIPEAIEMAEERNWDVDFYVTCLQNARNVRSSREGSFMEGTTEQDSHFCFFPEDRPKMLNVIHNASKPCVAFKLFAGGQIFHGKTEEEIPTVLENVYKEVFSMLKPCDVGAIGIFQGRKDQLSQSNEAFERAYQSLKL